jgi:CopG family nickel-responsive transcriptional regulator
MSRKERFGVSMDKELFDELTDLCRALKTDRSHIVNMATRYFILEKFHYAKPHQCEGVMIMGYHHEKGEEVNSIVEKYRELILGRSHFHTMDDNCLEVLFVRGDSERIFSLEKEVENYCVMCRYIPSHKP